jgi:hypothetical protein
MIYIRLEDLDGLAVRAMLVRRVMGDQKFVITSSVLRKARHDVSAAFVVVSPTNPHWARVVGYGPFWFCVIHKKGRCPSSGDINRLMMMVKRLRLMLFINTLKFMTSMKLVKLLYKPLFIIGYTSCQ